MDVMNYQQAEGAAELMQAHREELVERIARAMREDGSAQPLHGLHLYRYSSPLELGHGMAEPSVCVIAQGSKEVLLGDSRYRYDPSQYLLATVELPTIRRILQASQEQPFLSLRLELAPTLVDEVLLEAGHSWPRDRASVRAIAVSPLDGPLLDAFVRLTRLLDAPAQEARVLLPLITEEIIYRLLVGEQGAGSVTWPSWAATPPTSPEQSIDSVETLTSHCASRASRASWA